MTEDRTTPQVAGGSPAQRFKVGDLVQLRSGGPRMVVDQINELTSERQLQCQWFLGATLMNGWFSEQTLDPWAKESDGPK